MKPSRSLWLVFLLPMVIMVLPAVTMGPLTWQVFKEQSERNFTMQRADLSTLMQMATLEGELSEFHLQVNQAIRQTGGNAAALDQDAIGQQLDAIGQRVSRLAQSPLAIDVDQLNVTELQPIFDDYQHFTVMASQAIANQDNATSYLQQAQHHFNRFILSTQNRSTGLIQRASKRNEHAYQNLRGSLSSTLGLGIGALLLLALAAMLVAWRMNRHLITLGNALLSLSTPHQEAPALLDVQALNLTHSGPLKHLADALLTFRDTECQRSRAEKQLHQLAYYDELTDLPNWRLMREHLQHSLETNQQTQTYGALIYIDIDNFKRINDSSGNGAGDTLLREITQRLSALGEDRFVLGRLGGDEFMVIIDALGADTHHTAENAERFAENILQVLEEPYYLDGNITVITASLGITLFNNIDESVDSLFQQVNAAAHVAKQNGPGSIRFFDPIVQAQIEESSAMERDLRLAIKREEFVLAYQTQVNNQGQVTGVEALIRWKHPKNGMISPGQFIPLAEESGLIVPIGRWVIQTACEQLINWQASAHTADLTVAVNVSANQFQQANFVEEVATVLRRTQAPAHKLKLELTESIVLVNVEETIARMHQLKALGVRFAMDDFGTGYSSLQYLKRLPLSQIKIDQSFVRDLDHNEDDRAIVKTIIAMGNALNLEVIAEGVETLTHWRYLSEHHCHAYQGYYFCKPVCAQEVARHCRLPPPVLV
ncbi:putative bifunctional diguanylate cyclase/phosphodiesterase [Halomonas sp. LS-001]